MLSLDYQFNLVKLQVLVLEHFQQLKAEEPATEKAEKFQKAVVKLWLAEVKKRNISKENKCLIEDTTNKSLVSKKVVKF